MNALPGDEWKNSITPDQEEPFDTSDLTPLSDDDVREHDMQLMMLYAQQKKTNRVLHTLIEQCANRFVSTFCRSTRGNR